MNGAVPDAGTPAPGFTLPDQDGREVSLGDFRGGWVVLYFYPRDNTGGCTLEAAEFSALRKDFERAGASVAGISRDTPASHRRFIDSRGLSITLLSDPERVVHQAYGAWRLKKLYGRESMGAVRSTFLVDPEGVISRVWPSVKAPGHAAEVLEMLRRSAEG
jgi:peroxiredoxin Q/BCP